MRSIFLAYCSSHQICERRENADTKFNWLIDKLYAIKTSFSYQKYIPKKLLLQVATYKYFLFEMKYNYAGPKYC